MSTDHNLLTHPHAAPLVDQPKPDEATASRTTKTRKPAKQRATTTVGDATFIPMADGVYIQRGETEPRKLCGPLEIVAQLRDGNGADWCVLVKLADLDGHSKTHQIPRARLVSDQSPRVVEELAGLGLWLSSAKDRTANLMLYLQTGTDAPRARKIERTGWHESAFVLPDEVIGPTTENMIYMGTGKPPIATAGALEGWRDGIAKYAAGNPLFLLTLGAGFAGPLVRLTGLDSGGFHLHGDSKDGKSTLCDMAASIWGNPKDYRMSWKATAVGIEYASASYNDLPFVLDEINLAEPREVDSVVYLISQGKGKARGKDSGGLREFPRWCCFALSNGEQDLATVIRQAGKTIKAGQAVRLLSIPARRAIGVFDHCCDYTNHAELCAHLNTHAAKHHGTAGKAFMERLTAQDQDATRQEIRQALHDFAELMIDGADLGTDKVSAQVRHAAHYFALAGFALDKATEWGITGLDPLTGKKSAADLFEAWVKHRGGAGNEEERQIIQQVQAHFEQHGEARYTDLNRSIEDDSHAPKTMMRCGFREAIKETGRTNYYVLPQAWAGEVLKGVDARKANNLLASLGILMQDSYGKNQIQKKLPGMGNRRVYAVSPKLWEWED